MAEETPLPNSPEARTPTGEIKDQTTTPTPETTDVTTETKPTAPDKYTFTAPEGKALDAKTIDEVTPIFRELGLDNAQAQKLVDFWNTRVGDPVKLAEQVINSQLEKDRQTLAADPEIGGKLEQVKTNIGRLYDRVGDPKLIADFKAAMDYTGVGNNPAFVKVLNKVASLVGEGTHVSGKSPSPEGQTKPGESSRPSIAEAMWPNLARH